MGRRFEPDRAHVSLSQPQKDNSWLPIYLALGVVWGCSFIFIKLGLEFLTPFGVAFGRCVLGALTLLAWAKYKGIALPESKKVMFHLWVVSLLLNVIPGVFFALAETEVTSVLAGIINAVTPLMTLLAIMVVTRNEKPKLHQVVGILIGFTGVLTVLGAWKGLGDNPLCHQLKALLWLVKVFQLCFSIKHPLLFFLCSGRGGGIRTHGLLLPKQAR